MARMAEMVPFGNFEFKPPLEVEEDPRLAELREKLLAESRDKYIMNFNEYIMKPIFQKHKGKFNRIVLIDSVLVGPEVIDGFFEVIKDLEEVRQNPPQLINVVPLIHKDLTVKSQNLKTIHVCEMGNYQLGDLLWEHRYPAVSLNYPIEEWDSETLKNYRQKQSDFQKTFEANKVIYRLRAGLAEPITYSPVKLA